MKLLLLYFLLSVPSVLSSNNDITNAVFMNNERNRMPVAFGDFNSDELVDMFVLGEHGKSVEIMFASLEEPLFKIKPGFKCTFEQIITSAVPGDFDGDEFMDILITTEQHSADLSYTNVYILWGEGGRHLNCSNDKPTLQMIGQPLTIDYNKDMIIDLFGTDLNGTRTFWIFDTSRLVPPQPIPVIIPEDSVKLPNISIPHSNAILDLNGDYYPDLVITTIDGIEYWDGNDKGFKYRKQLLFSEVLPTGFVGKIGQSFHLDVESKEKMDLVLPICIDPPHCKESRLMIYSHDKWHDLKIDFKDQYQNTWGFFTGDSVYKNLITLRAGDFNMDGYPDLLATLKSSVTLITQSFLLENVPCDYNCGEVSRTFKVQWKALKPFYNESILAVFYDFYQDGILDVIFVLKDSHDKLYKTSAFKNTIDYDANFVKVMVLNNHSTPVPSNYIGKKKRTYHTNLPGPSIICKTTDQEGNPRNAIAAQIPQTAHFSLNLPFIIFGLGRTPNFINSLRIAMIGQYRDWTHIIPNSQMVVIPMNPIEDTSFWKAQLFVTPSKLILLSAGALTLTCGLITLIIGALYWKERREDKKEKLQEAHRFHFDAM